ncbi:MAG TPA: phosphoglycerate kinase, partial [Candidatus Absconditabacterales bacterium]|nr:phosphoglycerate kinase [Candidatus Absconditabacterales bacterium]
MYQISQSDLEKLFYKNIQFLDQKKILLRTCLNVPTNEKAEMLDDSRFIESYPLIKELALGAKMLLITAHLGRPKNQETRFSFEKIVGSLQEKFDQDGVHKKVVFLTSISEVNEKVLHSDVDCVYFLQNIRFFKEEESDNLTERAEFAKKLAMGFDCFVNDAFADYRESASTFDVARFLPSFLGPVFFREVHSLKNFSQATKPFVAVLGGAKLSEKIDILKALAEKA